MYDESKHAAGAKKITEREKIAIEWLIFDTEIRGNKPDKLTAYKVAHPGSIDDVDELKDIRSQAFRWFATNKISQYYNDFLAVVRAEQARRRELVEQKAVESVRTEEIRRTSEGGYIDFSDPTNQRRKLNELINTAEDAGEALDALKVIIASQKDDKQAAKERKQQLVYLPKMCSECELYRQADEIRLQNRYFVMRQAVTNAQAGEGEGPFREGEGAEGVTS